MNKSIIFCAAAAIVAACTGVTPTKVESENCSCLVCEACDSLEKYDNDSSTIAQYELWRDSLTTLVLERLYNNGEYWSYKPTDELLHNKKFIKALDNGYDGLCEIKDTTGTVDYFYGAYNYFRNTQFK